MPTHRFNWPAFRAFLHTVIGQNSLTTDKHEYVAISLPTSKQMNSELAKRLITSKTSFYLSHPVESFTIVGEGVLERVCISGNNRFRETSTLGKHLFNRVHHFHSFDKPCPLQLLGGFSFFNTLNKDSEWADFEPSLFHLPEWTIVQTKDEATLSLIERVNEFETVDNLINRLQVRLYSWNDSAPYDSNGDIELLSALTQSKINDSLTTNSLSLCERPRNLRAFTEWKKMIEKAKKAIDVNDLKKVVLARKVTQSHLLKPKAADVISNLEQLYPDCFVFCVNPEGKSYFIGATPERLARFTPTQVQTESLAGSTKRGKTYKEDDDLAGKLLNSKKDRLEHQIVIEAIEEDLVPYSEHLEHSNSPRVKKLPNVQHLYTPISAVFKKGISRTKVLKNLHPTPAVGGFPRKKALDFIEKEESFTRGWYASPIGWITSHGTGEFYVGIRSGLIEQDAAHFYAGCGIVKDSDPEKEWLETELKLKPMVDAVRMATPVHDASNLKEHYAKDPIL
ncbi:MAG: isochorismate synthase [Balneola sp.]|nr:isochorismate synthase [Balneola sp.]|tara:strand:- start:769 stop:2292 length:1524 start_codon:yes stop_codon:yes gene_type:complete